MTWRLRSQLRPCRQLRASSKNGRVIRIETDASGDASASTIDGGCTQIRACQRGRSMRQRIYAPERLGSR